MPKDAILRINLPVKNTAPVASDGSHEKGRSAGRRGL